MCLIAFPALWLGFIAVHRSPKPSTYAFWVVMASFSAIPYAVFQNREGSASIACVHWSSEAGLPSRLAQGQMRSNGDPYIGSSEN